MVKKTGEHSILRAMAEPFPELGAAERAKLLPTPRINAASLIGDAGVVKHLLGQNADPDTGRSKNGETALMVASRKGHVDVVRLLLACGADVSLGKATSGASALYSASYNGHLDVARLLLDHSADPNAATTDDGSTALMMTSQTGHLEVARLLLEHSADPNAAGHKGFTALLVASNRNHGKVARLLLEHGANPHTARTDNGASALFLGCQSGHVEVVQVLLEHSADPNAARTDNGATALIMACQQGYMEVARLLLEHSADPNKSLTESGSTALIMASQQGHMEVARLLLEHSADPNKARTNTGATALHLACKNGHTRAAQILALHGADLVRFTHSDQTAVSIATSRGHLQLARWLRAIRYANHAPFQIAVGCRLHADARLMLRTGALGDPTLCTLKEITDIATRTSLTGTPYPEEFQMAPVCPATTRLARDAMRCWSPERHWLFHGQLREAVHTVLLVRERLSSQSGGMVTGAGGTGLPYLPDELWFFVGSLLLRRSWAVTPPQ